VLKIKETPFLRRQNSKIFRGACPRTPLVKSASGARLSIVQPMYIRNPSMQKGWLRPCKPCPCDFSPALSTLHVITRQWGSRSQLKATLSCELFIAQLVKSLNRKREDTNSESIVHTPIAWIAFINAKLILFSRISIPRRQSLFLVWIPLTPLHTKTI